MEKFHLSLFEKLKPFDHVIWDWNGTIVNDFEQGVMALADLMIENNLEPITNERYHREFCFPIRDLYVKLGFDLNKKPFEELCIRYQQIWDKRAFQAKLHDGIKDFLEDLSLHKTQSILSAGIQWHVEEATKFFDVHHLFDHVFGIHDLQAASKINRGRELMEISKVAPEKTILIGDTDHDHEVARTLGASCLLIADGFQSYERLSKVHNNVIPSRYS